MEKKLDEFFAEARNAYEFWQSNRAFNAYEERGRGIGEKMIEKKFWEEYAEKFPTMMEYAKSIGAKSREDLSGKADFGQDDNKVLRQGNVLCWGDSSVWHFADWSPLTAFLQKKFGARKVVWNTEENGCGSLESLQLYEWEQIVTDILKHKELHPLLIGVNPELDTLLETAMTRPAGSQDSPGAVQG
jgi:hypothetical protein